MDDPHFDEDEMINDYFEDFDEHPADDYEAMMLEEFDAASLAGNGNQARSIPQINRIPVDPMPTQTIPTEMADSRHFEPQDEVESIQEPRKFQRSDDALFTFER